MREPSVGEGELFPLLLSLMIIILFMISQSLLDGFYLLV
jgi:hypothetical protein